MISSFERTILLASIATLMWMATIAFTISMVLLAAQLHGKEPYWREVASSMLTVIGFISVTVSGWLAWDLWSKGITMRQEADQKH